jgi:hypothetical protein
MAISLICTFTCVVEYKVLKKGHFETSSKLSF